MKKDDEQKRRELLGWKLAALPWVAVGIVLWLIFKRK